MAANTKRESAQIYSPLLADFIAKADAFITICETVKRSKVSLKSHSYYAPKARTLHAELQQSFTNLVQEHSDDKFASAQAHLSSIGDDMGAIEKSYPNDIPLLIKHAKAAKLTASSDLQVALRAIGAVPKRVVIADAYIPNELLEHHEEVHKKILWEINVCYQMECYNAAAVLIRRLVESLLVLAYEGIGATAKIQNKDGSFMTLEGVIGRALSGQDLKLTRNAKEGLPKLKFFGDLGAHNPRARIRKGDLDKVHEAVRVVIEELARYSAPKKAKAP